MQPLRRIHVSQSKVINQEAACSASRERKVRWATEGDGGQVGGREEKQSGGSGGALTKYKESRK